MFESDKSRLQRNQTEEALYTRAANEITNREIRPGLWAKAFAEVAGDEQKASARYIELRVETIKLEASAAEENRRLVQIQAHVTQKELDKEQERLQKIAEDRAAEARRTRPR